MKHLYIYIQKAIARKDGKQDAHAPREIFYRSAQLIIQGVTIKNKDKTIIKSMALFVIQI